MGVYIQGVNMPKQDELLQVRIYGNGKVSRIYDIECQQIGTAIETTQVVPIEEVWANVQPLKDKVLDLEEKLYLQNEIVRCKDCRYGCYYDDIEYYICKHPKGLHGELYGVDFCSYGKRGIGYDKR